MTVSVDTAMPTLHAGDLLVSRDEWLGPVVLWSAEATDNGTALTIPDLSIDLLWRPGSLPVILSRTVTPIATRLQTGDRFLGLRFPPWVASVDLDITWPAWKKAADSPERLPEVLRRALAEGRVAGRTDRRMPRILRQLDAPNARVVEVAAECGVSERQLQRWTTDAMRLRPKEIHRHLRVRRFVLTDPGLPLAERAAAAGFYDQAHAGNEIKAITGISAAELTRFRMSDSSKTTPDRPAML